MSLSSATEADTALPAHIAVPAGDPGPGTPRETTAPASRRARWIRRFGALAAAAALAAAGYGVYATTINITGNAGTDLAVGTDQELDTTIGCQTDPVTIAPVYNDTFTPANGYNVTLLGFQLTGLTQTCLDAGNTVTIAVQRGGTWQELANPLALDAAAEGALADPTGITAPDTLTITAYSLRLTGGQAPTAPTLTNATNGNTTTTVTWTPPATSGTTPVTGYQYTLNGGTTWTPLSTTTSPATIAGLTNNTTYQLAIRAVNATGPGPASATLTITPQATPENTPADIIIAGENTGL